MKAIQKHFSPEDSEKLELYLDQVQDTETTLIYLLYHTGMRQDELVKVTKGSIAFKGDKIGIYVEASKGSKPRWKQLPLASKARLEQLITSLGTGTAGMLVSDALDPETQKRNIRRLFHRVVTKAIGPHNYSTHSLRHSYALTCLQATGNDLLKVQRALGHKSVTSTVRYLNYLEDETLEEELLAARVG